VAAIEYRTAVSSAPPLVTDEFVVDLRSRAARAPALPVRPLTGREVAVAVRYALDEGCELALDLSAMKRIVIDPRARTVRIQPGVTTAELRQAAFYFGLAPALGPDGPATASLLAASVVTPDAELVEADAGQLRELRSGETPGIVVEATYRLLPAASLAA
jgi:FAD/FMN-containing dehydrogenase